MYHMLNMFLIYFFFVLRFPIFTLVELRRNLMRFFTRTDITLEMKRKSPHIPSKSSYLNTCENFFRTLHFERDVFKRNPALHSSVALRLSSTGARVVHYFSTSVQPAAVYRQGLAWSCLRRRSRSSLANRILIILSCIPLCFAPKLPLSAGERAGQTAARKRRKPSGPRREIRQARGAHPGRK